MARCEDCIHFDEYNYIDGDDDDEKSHLARRYNRKYYCNERSEYRYRKDSCRDYDDGNNNQNNNNSEGCYIATAVYKSYDDSNVLILRRFRDEKLLKTTLGRILINIYYSISPTLANKLKKWKFINNLVKHILDKIITKIHKSYLK